MMMRGGFPSQFLSVEIDEGDAEKSVKPEEPASPSSNTTSEDTGCESNLLQELENVCKLPEVLLAECTISLVSPEDIANASVKECRFDASVTPVYTKRQTDPSNPAESQKTCTDTENNPTVQNIEEVLQGVEAVYSDDEEGGDASARSVFYRKTVCQKCRREFIRKCQPTPREKPFGTDEYIPRGFPCTTCGKVYSQRSVLKKHEAVHSGYRLRCKVCGIDFTQRSSLLRHCKRIHGIASDHDIPTPLVPPDLRQIKPANFSASRLQVVPGLADRLTALLSKKEDTITLAVTKKPQLGPYAVNPHTVMTVTPDVIIRTEDS